MISRILLGVTICVISLIIIGTLKCYAQGKSNDNVPILRFAKVDDNLYRGGQPSKEEFALLKKMGIDTVVNFRSEEDLVAEERQIVESLGMKYISLPWTIYTPYDERVFDRFFEIIETKDQRPVFFHCKRGSERTGVIGAAYKIAYKGMSAKEAIEDAKKFDILPIWYFAVVGKIKKFDREFTKEN